VGGGGGWANSDWNIVKIKNSKNPLRPNKWIYKQYKTTFVFDLPPNFFCFNDVTYSAKTKSQEIKGKIRPQT
jgi:hypothetical protein